MTRDSKVPSLQPAHDDAPPEEQEIMKSFKHELGLVRRLHGAGVIPEGSSLSNHRKAIDLNAKRDKLKPEVTEDNRDHYQNPGTQLDADSNTSQASRPATFDQEQQTTASSLVLGNTHLAPEDSMAEPYPARTDEDAAKKQSDLHIEAVEKDFQNQKTTKASMASKRDAEQSTYGQDNGSGSQQSTTKYPDAPWRKRNFSECKRPAKKTPSAPPPSTPMQGAMMDSETHGDEQSVASCNRWKDPTPPQPLNESKTKKESTKEKRLLVPRKKVAKQDNSDVSAKPTWNTKQWGDHPSKKARWHDDQSRTAKKTPETATVHEERWHGWNEGTAVQSTPFWPSPRTSSSLQGAQTHEDDQFIEGSKKRKIPTPPAPPKENQKKRTSAEVTGLLVPRLKRRKTSDSSVSAAACSQPPTRRNPVPPPAPQRPNTSSSSVSAAASSQRQKRKIPVPPPPPRPSNSNDEGDETQSTAGLWQEQKGQRTPKHDRATVHGGEHHDWKKAFAMLQAKRLMTVNFSSSKKGNQ